MVDTGGIEPESRDVILSQMREQAQIAIDTADVIIFMVDVRQGLVDADSKVADMLRRSSKSRSFWPLIKLTILRNYWRIPMSFIIWVSEIRSPISSSGRLGIGDLLDEVVKHFPSQEHDDTEDDTPRIAIVGKPNVGKSSIVNKLTGKSRAIVSDIAGTTRDAIDSRVKVNGKEYILIDTAGLRRKNRIKERPGTLQYHPYCQLPWNEPILSCWSLML